MTIEVCKGCHAISATQLNPNRETRAAVHLELDGSPPSGGSLFTDAFFDNKLITDHPRDKA
jgi:hypothetical protein